MIRFDLCDTVLFNIGISIFSCIITLIIFYSVKKNFVNTYENQLFRWIEAGILSVLLSDMAMWILSRKNGDLLRAISYAITIFYFMMQLAIVFLWLRYAWYRVFGRKMSRKKERLFVLVPFVFLGIIVLTSPFNGWCFYLDDANYYHRGVLSVPMSVIILLYMLSITVVALAQYRKDELVDRKKELLTIAFFTVAPFFGGVMQMIFYGVSVVWPCVVVSSLLILLDKTSQAISQDALTGLNNRRNIERILRVYEERQNPTATLMMLDINNFKHINDKYGHSTGDMALIQVANILRTTFNGTSAFLARYGGDEFIIILPQGEESTAREVVEKIRNKFDHFSNTNQLPFRLSASIGYAVSNEKSNNKISDLLKQADENMYHDKALNNDHYHSG